MSQHFNPYHEWLGLDPQLVQPNYFELLGIDDSVSDAKAIAAAADRAGIRVRRFRPGEQAAAWAALLDQISAAKKCLTDPVEREKYQRQIASQKLATRSARHPEKSKKRERDVDPNMYPPGAAPPHEGTEVQTAADPVEPFGQTPQQPDGVPFFSPHPGNSQAPSPLDARPAGQNAYASQHPGVNPHAPFDPNTLLPPAMPPGSLPYAQTDPYPYAPANPMAPVVPLVPDPYAPTPHGGGPAPMTPAYGSPPTAIPNEPSAYPPTFPAGYQSPMAPAPMAPAPMAPAPMAPAPMAPAPMAQPIPTAAPNFVPMAQPLPSANPPAEIASETEPLLAVKAPSATALVAKRARASWMGPILFSVGAGLLILVVFIVVQLVNKNQPVSEVAQRGNDATVAVPATATTSGGSPATNEPIAVEPSNAPPDTPPGDSDSPDMPAVSVAMSPEKIPSSVPETSVVPAPTEPPGRPTPKPVPSEPEPPAAMKAAANQPLSREDLVRLSRAMQKGRDAISDHNFDLATEFLAIGREMAQAPDHKQMIERLQILLDSVQPYREAILAGAMKIEPGATFNVGETPVSMVEAGRDRVVVRASGQNRGFALHEMPPGLAAALAAQVLPSSDPATLTMKGAYVIVHPNAKPAEVEKAREFLQEAATNDDNAKALLLLFDDQYDLARQAGTR